MVLLKNMLSHTLSLFLSQPHPQLLLSLNPINREPWIDQWNRENRLCLPQGFGEVTDQRTIRVFWRSSLGSHYW